MDAALEQPAPAAVPGAGAFYHQGREIFREKFHLVHFITKVVKFSAKSFIWVNPDSYGFVYGEELDPHREEVEVRITHVGEWKNEAMRYWSGDIELTEV